MTTILDIISKDEKEAERLAQYGIDKNPDMRNFEEFEQAFLSAFNTPTGQNLISFINNEESKILFETKVVQEVIKKNIGEEKFEQIQGETEEFDVFRAVPKGQKTSKKDFVLIRVGKTINVPSYSKGEIAIKSYSKSYMKWTPAQEKYIISQKAKNIPTRQLIANYNTQFKDNQRPASSIATKSYRMK